MATNIVTGVYPHETRNITASSFTDITPKVVTNIEWDGENDMTVTFAEALTDLEWVKCRRRIRCDVDREALEQSAQNAIVSHNTFLAIATPTNAQILAHVRLLSRVDKGLIKTEVPDLALLDPTPNA